MLKLSYLVECVISFGPLQTHRCQFSMFSGRACFQRAGLYILFFRDTKAPRGPGSPKCRGYTITLRHTTLGTTPLDGWKARSKDLYLTTHNTHHETDIHAPGGIRTHNPAAADSRLRPRDHRDRQPVYKSTNLTYETRFERIFRWKTGCLRM